MALDIEEREGKLLACGGIDTMLHIFQINPSGRKNQKLNLIEKAKVLSGHYGLVTCCGFLSQQFLISASYDSSLMLWDLEKSSRFLVKYRDHSSEILTLDVFQLDGNILATGSNDCTGRVWDIRMKNACIRVFDIKKSGVSSVKFMPENVNTIAFGCEDSLIKIYDLRAIGKVGKLKETSEFKNVSSMSFSNSGRLLFSSYNNNKIKVWDILAESKAGELQGVHQDVVKSISLSSDGSTLASAGKDGIVSLWV
mmetsp:Transcript_17352/g.12404  ORF Transcript_17352/g.12404 Transcript_17352/m.12404 type:complete len:253 (-) Transcript_17352:11-769(-)